MMKQVNSNVPEAAVSILDVMEVEEEIEEVE